MKKDVLLKKEFEMEEIIFIIEESFDGCYNARALGHSIFTDGEDENDLRNNIKDAVSCHFDDNNKPKIIRLHYVRQEIISNV